MPALKSGQKATFTVTRKATVEKGGVVPVKGGVTSWTTDPATTGNLSAFTTQVR